MTRLGSKGGVDEILSHGHFLKHIPKNKEKWELYIDDIELFGLKTEENEQVDKIENDIFDDVFG